MHEGVCVQRHVWKQTPDSHPSKDRMHATSYAHGHPVRIQHGAKLVNSAQAQQTCAVPYWYRNGCVSENIGIATYPSCNCDDEYQAWDQWSTQREATCTVLGCASILNLPMRRSHVRDGESRSIQSQGGMLPWCWRMVQHEIRVLPTSCTQVDRKPKISRKCQQLHARKMSWRQESFFHSKSYRKDKPTFFDSLRLLHNHDIGWSLSHLCWESWEAPEEFLEWWHYPSRPWFAQPSFPIARLFGHCPTVLQAAKQTNDPGQESVLLVNGSGQESVLGNKLARNRKFDRYTGYYLIMMCRNSLSTSSYSLERRKCCSSVANPLSKTWQTPWPKLDNRLST